MDSRLGWRDLKPDLYENSAVDVLGEIRAQASWLDGAAKNDLDASQRRWDGRESHGPWNEPPDEWIDLEDMRSALRILRGAFFLAGFSYFEFRLLELASGVQSEVRPGSATSALHILQPMVALAISDWDNLYGVVDELKCVRDELAHALGFERDRSRHVVSVIKQMQGRGELTIEDDSSRGKAVYLQDEFLSRALSAIRQVLLVCGGATRSEGTPRDHAV